MRVAKYHGTGNDFVVVSADAAVPDRPRFARAASDRADGVTHPDSPRVGADGVLFLDLHPGDPPRVDMTLVQPDGSTAAMCGNGARCAADWAVRRLAETEGDAHTEIVVEADAGARPAEVGEEVTIGMGEPRFAPEAVPVESAEPLVEEPVGGLSVTAIHTGVPHAVAFVDDVADVDVAEVGPGVRYADVFPEGANLTVAARRADGGFDQRTYERGVEDETRSCGTGAVAVAAAAQRLGLVDRGEAVPVHPPGGRLVVTVTDAGATLRGPVVREFVTDLSRPAADATGD
jgi:diaminopimelate epimerase